MAFSHASLDSLSVRPPTPPKGLDEVEQGVADALEFLQSDLTTSLSRASSATRPQLLDTPPASSPISSQGQSGDSCEAARKAAAKKVGFSPWPNYHRPPNYNLRDCGLSPLKHLPPSRELRSFRPILKQSPQSALLSSSHPTDNSASPAPKDPFPAFETMLDYMLRQLEHGDEKARTDAYVSLCGTLGACECLREELDMGALHSHMDRLMKYIRRDCTFASGDSKVAETGLIVQSLKLFSIFLLTPALSRTIKDDVRIFAIERSISVLRDPTAPKPVIKHYMFMLSQQRFNSTIVTTARAQRLLDSLQSIEERAKGNSVIGGRLSVYHRLLSQARSAFLSKIDAVLEHVFHGMLSSIGDIRKRAIDLGVQIGLVLGKSGQSHRALVNHFATVLDSERHSDYGSFYASRLQSMFHNKACREDVPQIWSVAMLFFQDRAHRIPRWPHVRSWFRIIQLCLNCSDAHVRFQAYFAWNKLIFVVSPSTATTQEMVNMLLQPLCLQLRRTESGRSSTQVKQFAFSSYCTLLYYSFRPSKSPEELDYFWGIYVKDQLPDLLMQGHEYIDRTNQILSAFFGVGENKPWDEGRANSPDPVKPRELPQLSAKWLRKRISAILPILERVFEADCQREVSFEDMPSARTWVHLMGALAEAGSQEVKASSELREATAQIITSLYRLWNKILFPQGRESGPAKSSVGLFTSLAYSAMSKLGSLHFTQRILVEKHFATFEVAPSPSHRSHKPTKPLQSPFHCIYQLMLSLPFFGPCREAAMLGLSKLVHLAYTCQNTLQDKFSLLQDCTDIALNPKSLENGISAYVWPRLANEIREALSSLPVSHPETGQPPGQQLWVVTNILVSALRSDMQVCSASQLLFEYLVNAARNKASELGETRAMIGLLTQVLSSCKTSLSDDSILFCTSLVLGKSYGQEDPQLPAQEQWIAWDWILQNQDEQVAESFEEICCLIDESLHRSFRRDQFEGSPFIHQFLSSLSGFLDSTPRMFKAVVLCSIQNGLASMLEDAEDSCNKADDLLKKAAPLISAGFGSRHRCFTSMSVDTWNDTFGKTEGLEYPDSVEFALRQLGPQVDICLPNFPYNDGDRVCANHADTAESTRNPGSNRSNRLGQALKEPGEVIISQSPHPLRTINSEEQAPTPATRRIRSPVRPTPKARLKHDDSQIEFAVIESSPTNYEAMESQLLTEHQKEVRSQQQAEAAAMFPDIRSGMVSRAKQTRELAINNTVTDIEEPATPSPQLEPMDDYLSSSPTPGSAAKRDLIMRDDIPSSFVEDRRVSHDDSEEEEPPSSPPESMGESDETCVRDSVQDEQAYIEYYLQEYVDLSAGEALADTANTTRAEREPADPEQGALLQASPSPSAEVEMIDANTGTPQSYHKMDDEYDGTRGSAVEEPKIMTEEQHTTGLDLTGYSMSEGQARGLQPTDAALMHTEMQIGPEASRTGSEALVDASCVISDEVSDTAEEEEIFVDASQSPLQEKVEDLDDNEPSRSDERQPRTLIADLDNQDSSQTDDLTDVCDSFLIGPRQTQLEASAHKTESFETLDLRTESSPDCQSTDEDVARKTKRKRSFQDSTKTRSPTKRRRSHPLQPIAANSQNTGDDEIQECITVLPSTIVSILKREHSTRTLSRSQTSVQLAKQQGQPPTSAPVYIQPEDGLSLHKRKMPSSLSQEDKPIRNFRSGEGGSIKVDRKTSDDQIEQNTADEEPIAGSLRFSHVEIETSQHGRVRSSEPMYEDVFYSSSADDSEGGVSVGGTKEDVDAVRRTAGRAHAEDAEARQQLVSEEKAAQAARRIAQPKSIIERLKGVLADCKGVIFGSQDRLQIVTATLPTGESVEILLHGATVISWKSGGVENLWLSEKAVLDGSKPVRGGIPVVFPVFGGPPANHATSTLPSHGFARNSRWEYLGKSTSESGALSKGGDDTVKLDFGLYTATLSEEAKKAWPYDFGLVYSVTLGKDGLQTMLNVRNEGKVAFEFQMLLHTYFRVKDVSRVAVKGLTGVTYIDKVLNAQTATESNSAVRITGETDRVYQSIPQDTTSIVEADQPRYDVVRDNLEDTVVWNPWKEKAASIGDFEPKNGYVNMICVEVGSVKGWQKLDGGETFEGGQIIRSLP
ncbi:MAG: hypothetical protein Q9165_007813 [Trypethelium subeluteriae]